VADVETLGGALARAAARLVGFHSVLYARPTRGRSGGIDARHVEGADAAAAARLLLEGHGVPRKLLSPHGAALVAAVDRVSGSLYLAAVDGAAAAAAALTVADGVGYLANAATFPAFRRRGCQTALIEARVADAADAGCELVTSGAEFGSASQRNLERAGFRVAYTKPVLRLGARAERGRAGTA
jgi:ribosomal protein S18 acetylase RimI-like enzyme